MADDPRDTAEKTRSLRDAIVARVDRRLQSVGVSATKACVEAGIGRDTIRDWKRKTERVILPRIDSLLALATPLKTTAQWLILGEGPESVTDHGGGRDYPVRLVPVVGRVQAGRWAESTTWEDGDERAIPVLDRQSWRQSQLYGLEVRGESMNRVYPEGTIVIVERGVIDERSIEVGARYHVEIQRIDGTVESTLKSVHRRADGRVFLVPESTDPTFDKVDLTAQSPGEHVSIVGKVVFSMRDE